MRVKPKAEDYVLRPMLIASLEYNRDRALADIENVKDERVQGYLRRYADALDEQIAYYRRMRTQYT